LTLFLKAIIANFFSLATSRVVIGLLTLASQLHYVPEQLKPFLTMLPLESTSSAFSL